MLYEKKNKDLIVKYYESWITRNKKVARECLADNLSFRSPQDVFSNADDFLDGCWHYGQDVNEIKFVKFVVQTDEAFVLLEWFHSKTGKSFHDTEYIKIENGKIKEILVIINDPEFYRNLMRE
jgi:hypothetical protein